MAAVINKIFNLNVRTLFTFAGDDTFLDLMALYLSMKASHFDARVRFKNQKELLRKIKLGHERFTRIKNHELFDKFFRLDVERGFIVVRSFKLNGPQLTFGIGDHEKPNNRVIIELDKNQVTNINYVRDQILVALFTYFVKHVKEGLGGVLLLLPEYLKRKTVCNLKLAKLFCVGTSKVKQITKMAVEQGLVVKKPNIICKKDYTGNPFSGITELSESWKSKWEKLSPEFKVGNSWESNGMFFWQIGNTYNLTSKDAKFRNYWGKNDTDEFLKPFIEKKRSENRIIEDLEEYEMIGEFNEFNEMNGFDPEEINNVEIQNPFEDREKVYDKFVEWMDPKKSIKMRREAREDSTCGFDFDKVVLALIEEHLSKTISYWSNIGRQKKNVIILRNKEWFEKTCMYDNKMYGFYCLKLSYFDVEQNWTHEINKLAFDKNYGLSRLESANKARKELGLMCQEAGCTEDAFRRAVTKCMTELRNSTREHIAHLKDAATVITERDPQYKELCKFLLENMDIYTLWGHDAYARMLESRYDVESDLSNWASRFLSGMEVYQGIVGEGKTGGETDAPASRQDASSFPHGTPLCPDLENENEFHMIKESLEDPRYEDTPVTEGYSFNSNSQSCSSSEAFGEPQASHVPTCKTDLDSMYRSIRAAAEQRVGYELFGKIEEAVEYLEN